MQPCIHRRRAGAQQLHAQCDGPRGPPYCDSAVTAVAMENRHRARLARTISHLDQHAAAAATTSPINLARTDGASVTDCGPAGFDPARLAAAQRYARELVSSGVTSGLCLAVSRHGRRLSVLVAGTSGPAAGIAVTHGLLPQGRGAATNNAASISQLSVACQCACLVFDYSCMLRLSLPPRSCRWDAAGSGQRLPCGIGDEASGSNGGGASHGHLRLSFKCYPSLLNIVVYNLCAGLQFDDSAAQCLGGAASRGRRAQPG